MRSPVGEYKTEKDFKLPSVLELENFRLKVSRSRGEGTRGPGNPELAPLKDFGGRLYKSLFQGPLKVALESSLREVDRAGCGLRILLRLGASGRISELPWEFLYDSDRRRFFVHSRWTPLVRYLEMPDRPNPLTVQAPLRVLVMISSPNGLAPLDVEQEWNQVNQALAELKAAGQVYVERLEGATLTHLHRRLRHGKFHVFHFIGHGVYLPDWQDGVLMVEDPNGNGRKVTGEEIGGMLHDRGIRLAVLNACEGGRGSGSDPFAGPAQSLIQQGLPAVVAMQFEITDVAAIAFAREFYQTIADGYPLDAAVYDGRRAILSEVNNFEWGTPVLYSRTHDGRIFDEVAQSGPSEAATVPSGQQRPPRPETATEPGGRHPRSPRSETVREPEGKSESAEQDGPAALIRRAVGHRELGRHDEALLDLDRALTLEPDGTAALVERGALLAALGRNDEALRDLDRALVLEPDNTVAILERGAAYWGLAQYRAALRDLDRLLRLEPDNASALHGRGATYQELGRHEEALRDLDRAVQLKPEDPYVLTARGTVHLATGDQDAALRDLDRALRLEPDNVMALVLRGTAYRNLQRYDDALRDLDRLLRLEPDNAFALHGRGDTYRELGLYGEALRDLDRALELEPDNAQALITRGTVYQTLGQDAAAVRDFNRALALDPDLTPTLPGESAPHSVPASDSDGRQAWVQAYEVDYDDISARPVDGGQYWELARYGEALRDLNQAAEQDANEAFLLRDRAMSYLELGRYEEALNDLDRSLELDPDSAVAVGYRGLAYKALGDYSRALLDFDRSMGLDPTIDWVQEQRAILLGMLSS